MNTPITRQDPIRENYYRPLEIADQISDWMFYIGSILSLAVLLINKATYPIQYQMIQVIFVLAVAVFFVSGIGTRLYFFPRAEDARRKEFLSSVCGVELIHERTSGYYNNNETDPDKRLSLCVLENTFFSKSILRKMAAGERTKALVYFLVFCTAVFWRETSFDWIAAGAQIVFSEVIFSKWLRLEWQRNRAENVYQTTLQLIQAKPSPEILKVHAMDAFGKYETGKALGGVLLSKRVFDELNPSLTIEWEQIKRGLQ